MKPAALATDARRPDGEEVATRKPSFLLLIPLAAIVASVGLVIGHSWSTAVRRGAESELGAISSLKVGQIVDWLQSQKDQAFSNTDAPRFAPDIEKWGLGGRIDEAALASLIRRMSSQLSHHGYARVQVYDLRLRTLTGVPSPDIEDNPERAELLRRAIAERQILFSSIHAAAPGLGPSFVIDMVAPIIARDEKGERPAGAMLFEIDPERFLFPRIRSWPTASTSGEILIVERHGEEVVYLNPVRRLDVRPLELRLSIGKRLLPEALGLRGARGFVEGEDYVGAKVLAYLREVDGTPWLLVAQKSTKELYAPLRDELLLMIVLGAAIVALSAFAILLMRRAGDRDELLRREERALRSATEKEILFKELQHRVKNSLSIITGLIGLEALRADDSGAGKILESLEDRVRALASLYDLLYRSAQASEIDLSEYLPLIAGHLRESYATDTKGVEVRASVDPVIFDAKRAISLGLIMTELVTDSVKHAFPEGRRGSIRIGLRHEGAGLYLEISDDGVGLPPGFDRDASKGLGMKLVTLLARDLGGALEVSSTDAGTSWRLRFPVAEGG
jgi:two-component sensor histidine kinase